MTLGNEFYKAMLTVAEEMRQGNSEITREELLQKLEDIYGERMVTAFLIWLNNQSETIKDPQ